MKKHIGLSLMIATPLLFSGCTSAVNSTERTNSLARPSIVEDHRVQPDGSLGRKLAIVQVNEDVVSGDMMRIQVILLNQKSKSMSVNYLFEWFDENGMVLNSSVAWEALRFSGSERKAITGIAPTPNAVDFNLKIQEPRPFTKRNKLNPFTP